jgi:hypothetical protein
MGKLSKRREWFYLVIAWEKSETERPHADYFRAAAALAAHDPILAEVVTTSADAYRGALSRYRDRHGEPPTEISVTEIKERASTRVQTKVTLGALLAALGESQPVTP